MARTSNKAEQILNYVNQFIQQNGYSPSVREIMEAVGLRSTASVHYHLGELNRLGVIQIDSAKNRSIRVNENRGVPLVGVVTAGQPILAVENIEDYIPWEGDADCFALRVRGDSMIEAGIFEGDKLIVRPQPDAENGEIVVALLQDEATVKRLRKQAGEVWLMPENSAYEPIDGRNARILGKVRAVIREY